MTFSPFSSDSKQVKRTQNNLNSNCAYSASVTITGTLPFIELLSSDHYQPTLLKSESKMSDYVFSIDDIQDEETDSEEEVKLHSCVKLLNYMYWMSDSTWSGVCRGFCISSRGGRRGRK